MCPPFLPLSLEAEASHRAEGSPIGE